MSEKTPPDHPIQKVWEDNRRAREDPVGMALEGDRRMVDSVLGSIWMKAERQLGRRPDAPPASGDLLSRDQWEFLATTIRRIRAEGWTPDQALARAKPPGSGRGRRSDDSGGRLWKATLAREFGELIESEPPLTHDEAAEIVAERHATSSATVKKAWSKYSL